MSKCVQSASGRGPLDLAKMAQEELRSTQHNWEECLFECDDILTELIEALSKKCPECGSDIAFCMMGHYCGEVVRKP